MLRLLLSLWLSLWFLLMPVLANAASCYTPEQYRAEQAVRYHSRLMVVGMLCQRVLSPTAYKDYQKFTTRNQAVIRAQENLLLGYFKQQKKGNAERALHSLRTDLANAYAMQASRSARSFCHQYAGQLLQAKTMQPPQFSKWIQAVKADKTITSTQPICVAPQRKR